MPQINLEYPLWFFIFCLIAGALYAWLLYSKESPWNNTINKALTVFRFLSVAVLVFLLLNPLLKQVISVIENPTVVLAVDNSASILNGIDEEKSKDVLLNLDQFSNALKEEGYDVEIRTLDAITEDVNAIEFNNQITNINGLLKEIQNSYEGRNLAGSVLISDGNYNQGISPAYFPYGFKVYSLGIGDTTKKEDLILKNVYYNKIAYQGNKFPIRVEVLNQGLVNSETKLTVSQKGKIIDSRTLRFDKNNSLSTVDFSIEAKEKGVQRYNVQLAPLQKESVKANNYKQIFIDVVEGKQKILVVAPAAHPDIKALRSVINSNDNYEFDHFIPGMTQFKNEKYDLVIVHQAYDKFNRTIKQVKKFQEDGVPILYIIGKQTNLVIMSRENEGFNFKMVRSQTDVVSPALNETYSKFKYSIDHNAIIREYPPVKVPYGNFELGADADVLLYQKVGSITTSKPLIYSVENVQGKSGYIVGDGFWQWRMQEYALTESTEVFDDIFLKLIQYLSTKEDKRKFKLYTSKSEYFDNEAIQLNAELYDEIYERIYGNEVKLHISSESGFQQDYTFTTTSANSGFKLSGLEEGVYTYRGTTVRGGTRETATGRFTVRKLQLELLDQTADFSLLREVSNNTQGQFYLFEQSDELLKSILQLDSKGVIHSQEDFSSLINLKWIFFIILTLISIEWFTRKYSGGY